MWFLWKSLVTINDVFIWILSFILPFINRETTIVWFLILLSFRIGSIKVVQRFIFIFIFNSFPVGKESSKLQVFKTKILKILVKISPLLDKMLKIGMYMYFVFGSFLESRNSLSSVYFQSSMQHWLPKPSNY